MASNTRGRPVLVTAAALMCLLLVAAPRANAVVSCGQVATSISPCINYIRGVAPLTGQCCNGARTLNAAASTTPDRQAACNCLKNLSGRVSEIDMKRAGGLPVACGVSIPYPISTATDCTKVR